MLLLPGNAKNLSEICVDPVSYGWFLTPRRTMTRSGFFTLQRYAVDNECFTLGNEFDPVRFKRALGCIRQSHGVNDCLFVVAPDVVGDAVATLARFGLWAKEIRDLGFPVALAAQDGLEDLVVPWADLDALFVGGSTEWKLSACVADLIRGAKGRGKWTHIGRVNSVRRASRLREYPDSVDGTAWVKHPSEYAARWHRWVCRGRPKQLHLL